jgi:pimeloyl-ACP methyl ester carboxylesterase
MAVELPSPVRRLGGIGTGVLQRAGGRAVSVVSALDAGVRAATDARVIRGITQELVWVGAHTASYPLGLLRERISEVEPPHRLGHLPPHVRGLHHLPDGAADVPVILVHGLIDNRSIFAVLRRTLARRGFHRVICHSFSFFTRDMETAAADLGDRIEQVCAETGHDQVVIVGHSLGGLLARWYVQKLGGDSRVRTVVTLGTPHAGSRIARIWPTELARQLLPGSPALQALEEPAPGCQTRFVAVWSDLDELISPKASARLEHPDLISRNVLVRGVGHMALLISGRVQHQIVTALAGLEIPAEIVVTDPLLAPARAVSALVPRQLTPAVIDLRDSVLERAGGRAGRR